MAMDLPPPNVPVPAIHAPAPECRLLNQAEAQVAFARLKGMLPSTSFVSARPSQVCGLVQVTMASGKTAYTDATGRFFLLAFALDTHSGSPADNEAALGAAVGERETFPATAPAHVTGPYNPAENSLRYTPARPN